MTILASARDVGFTLRREGAKITLWDDVTKEKIRSWSMREEKKARGFFDDLCHELRTPIQKKSPPRG